MNSLAELRNFNPANPAARIWNRMIAAVEERTLKPGVDFGGKRGDFQHPFKVVVGAWDDMPAELQYPTGRTWRVAVAPGTVNDELATIIYRREGDPRGWRVPDEGYPGAPLPGTFGYAADSIDRGLLDTQPEPPFLVVTTPTQSEDELGSFLPVPDGSRLPFFQTEAMWKKRLFRCFVVLTADPAMARFYLPTVPVKLRRFRLFAGPQPSRGVAQNGGWTTVARLWLTRDLESNDPATDEIYVQQMLFWCLGTHEVLDSMQLPEAVVLPDFQALFQESLDEVYASAAATAFWSH